MGKFILSEKGFSLFIGGLLETCLLKTENPWENFLDDFRSL